jgi:hypothetical protein
MKRNLKGQQSLLTIISIVFLLLSCSSNVENAILGKWDLIDGEGNMEFFKDGTVSIVEDGSTMGGSYKFVEKGRIKFEFGGLGALAGPRVVKVSISGNELAITNPQGDIAKFKRAN